jgi:hypothetical protein
MVKKKMHGSQKNLAGTFFSKLLYITQKRPSSRH